METQTIEESQKILEDGFYTAEFAIPGGNAKQQEVQVVQLTEIDEEIRDHLKDPVSQTEFKLGQQVLRVKTSDEGDFATYTKESLDYVNPNPIELKLVL